MFHLKCKLIPGGIKPIKYINIGGFKTISQANAAARGFAFGAQGGIFGIIKHETSPSYYCGYSKGAQYKSCHFQLIYY
tara:strand:+ start:281 stop:514 length:234 start_codon:yes stop_codon:yes gene_type:complete